MTPSEQIIADSLLRAIAASDMTADGTSAMKAMIANYGAFLDSCERRGAGERPGDAGESRRVNIAYGWQGPFDSTP